MRGWFVMMALVAGCLDAAPPETPAEAPVVTIDGRDVSTLAVRGVRTDDAPATPDLCALAAALPADNLCSLMCDPDAIEARLLDEGTPAGTCYEFLCALPDLSVSVGVCLPPRP